MVKITDKYYMNAEKKCYVLQEKTIVKDEKSSNFGKVEYDTIGYYTTIESLLEGVLKFMTREEIKNNDLSFKQLIKYINEQKEIIKALNVEI